MPELVKKSFNAPDATREFLKTEVDIVSIDGFEVRRMTVQPGWHWAESMKEALGVDSCPVDHLYFTISGQLLVQMDDGSQDVIGPGEIGIIPKGHDAWVVGDEPVVGIDFQGNDVYQRLMG